MYNICVHCIYCMLVSIYIYLLCNHLSINIINTYIRTGGGVSAAYILDGRKSHNN